MITRILNDMNLPENVAKIHPNYGQSVLELPAWERQQILSSSMSLMVASSGSQQGDESIGGALRESASQHAISAGSTQLHETPLGYMRRFGLFSLLGWFWAKNIPQSPFLHGTLKKLPSENSEGKKQPKILWGLQSFYTITVTVLPENKNQIRFRWKKIAELFHLFWIHRSRLRLQTAP